MKAALLALPLPLLALVACTGGRAADTSAPPRFEILDSAGVRFRDLSTKQSSLEDIFVSLVQDGR